MASVTDWSKFTVIQLKGILTRRGLDNQGNKEELVERIAEHERTTAVENPVEEKEPEKEEPEVKGLQRKEFVAIRDAMRSVMSVHIKDFKPSTFSEEGFISWLESVTSYNFQRNRYGETTTELRFKSVDKGDGAYIDMKALLNTEVTHTVINPDAAQGTLCNRVLILEGLSTELNNEEKLQEYFPEAEYVYSFNFLDGGLNGLAALEFETVEEANAYFESVGDDIEIEDNKIVFHKSSLYFNKFNRKVPADVTVEDEERIQLNSEAVALQESADALINSTEIFGTEKIKVYFEKQQRLLELMLRLGPDTRRRVKAGEKIPEADDVVWKYTQQGTEQFNLEKAQKKITDLESEQAVVESKLKQIQLQVKDVFKKAPAEGRKNLKVTLASNKGSVKQQNNSAAKKNNQKGQGNQQKQNQQQQNSPGNQQQADNASFKVPMITDKLKGKSQNSAENDNNRKRRLNSGGNTPNNSANKRSASAGSNDTPTKRKRSRKGTGQNQQNQNQQNKGQQNKGQQNKGQQNKGQQNKGQQNKGQQNKGQQNKGAYSNFKKQGAGNQQQGNRQGKWQNRQNQQSGFPWNQPSGFGDNINTGGMPRKEDLLQGITNVLSEKMKRLEQLHHATMQTQQQMNQQMNEPANMGYGMGMPGGFNMGMPAGSNMGMSAGSNMGLGSGMGMSSGSGMGMGVASGMGSGPGMGMSANSGMGMGSSSGMAMGSGSGMGSASSMGAGGLSASTGMGGGYSQSSGSSYRGSGTKVVDYQHNQGGSASSSVNRQYGFTSPR